MHGMIAWFARNSVAANLLMVGIIAFGYFAMQNRIPLEVFPEFERDIINIVATYRGATPSEVEEAIVVRIEEAIADLDGIQVLKSFAYEGVARIRVEVDKNYSARDLLDDIKNKIDAISTFPDDVDPPTFAIQLFRREVISVALSAELPEEQLRSLAEQVRDDLTALPDVNLVEVIGVRAYEISIEVSEDNLHRYGVTFQQIVSAIQKSSADLPGGTIKTKGGEILLRTQGQAYVGEDFANITIYTRADGTRLRLGEIATINDGFEENPAAAFFNEKPAIIIEVYRTGLQNSITIANTVREYIEQKKQFLPEGVQLDYWRDRSRIVKLRLNTLLKSAWQGGILVFLCLAFFLRISVAFWVCIGIPVSFMGAISVMPILGTTFNLISLFAFILVLGIVVDDAIITGENIYSHLKRKEKGIDAVIQGAQEVSVPVTFGLLTTVAAFTPLLFIEGFRGPIFSQIPMIVIPVLLFSWIESKLILPAHMRHIHIQSTEEKGQSWLHYSADGLESVILNYYKPALKMAINYRYLTFALFFGFSIIIISYVSSGRYKYTFFPKIASETARATLIMPSDTNAHITRQHLQHMAKTARQLQLKYTDKTTGQSVIRNILTRIGQPSSRSAATSNAYGRISLELMPPEERTMAITTQNLVQEWRQKIGQIPGVKALYFRAEIGHGGDPVNIQLASHDLDALEKVAAKLSHRLSEYPGLFDIQDSFEAGKTEIRLTLKPDAELLGLSVEDLGRQVRFAFFGAQAQRIQRGRHDIRVMVRLPLEERSTLQTLENMLIRNADGVEIPLGQVSNITFARGYSRINREDRQRTVNVHADMDKDKVDLNKMAIDIIDFLQHIKGEYPKVNYTMAGELQEQEESFQSLINGGVFVLFSIYVLLAIPLRSYGQPFIVMLVIPFSIIGALLGHMLLGMNLSVMSLMGILALSGVVVNDSLVLVAWINQGIAKGVRLIDAVSQAGIARFRPILLTSLTTFAGLIPLILEKSTQAQFLIPMAVSLGFGILYATLLSLILVPIGYLILQDFLSFVRVIRKLITANNIA